ncbi:MAG: glycosyltransferase family 2 protein [Chloroflexi bacterium]|nr:glycosyltransferase family 2 protein [Chloroflexota bacterium]
MTTSHPSVDVVIPVLNEEKALPVCVARLREFLPKAIPNPYRIVIADNGSSDRTLDICQELSQRYPDVAYIRLEQRGRGRALKKAWLESSAGILSYMDVDLSTDINAFPAMVKALEDGAHVAYGSRLARGAKVYKRTLKREITSRGYNALIKLLFCNHFSDAQCGFKAVTRETAQAIVPHVVNNNWFFDTELLLIAEKRGFRLKGVPVVWTDDPDTRVRIMRTVAEDVKGLFRLRFGGMPRVERPR